MPIRRQLPTWLRSVRTLLCALRTLYYVRCNRVLHIRHCGSHCKSGRLPVGEPIWASTQGSQNELFPAGGSSNTKVTMPAYIPPPRINARFSSAFRARRGRREGRARAAHLPNPSSKAGAPPNLAQLGPKFDRIRPNLAEFGTKFIEVGPPLVRPWPEFQPNRPNADSDSTSCWRLRVSSPKSGKSAHFSRNIRQRGGHVPSGAQCVRCCCARLLVRIG